MGWLHQKMGSQLIGVDNCPHCGISSPYLVNVWTSKGATPRSDRERPSAWAAYLCTTCGSLVAAKGAPGIPLEAPVVGLYPSVFEVSAVVPERVRNYLTQAHRSLASPDASVMMSASSVDAMLKAQGLSKGTLYNRIDEAVDKGILTKTMAEWAHRVRLDANNPRHADEETPHMTSDHARRAFEFANALTEFLYILPAKMPAKEDVDQDG